MNKWMGIIAGEREGWRKGSELDKAKDYRSNKYPMRTETSWGLGAVGKIKERESVKDQWGNYECTPPYLRVKWQNKGRLPLTMAKRVLRWGQVLTGAPIPEALRFGPRANRRLQCEGPWRQEQSRGLNSGRLCIMNKSKWWGKGKGHLERTRLEGTFNRMETGRVKGRRKMMTEPREEQIKKQGCLCAWEKVP